MLSLSTLISLAIVGSASFFGVQAQCIQNAGYLGAYDVGTGAFVGAVARTLGGSGIFTLSKNGTTSDYLAVVAFSNTCGDGGPVFLQILSPVDPAAGYVSLTFGNPNCAAGFFTNNEAWAPIAAADGFPHGQFPTPGPTRTTIFGGYGSLNTFCGENMVFALGTAVNRQVLLPAWKDPNSVLHTALPVVQDSTFNRLLATPDPATYSITNSGASIQQVYLSIFI
ncbi:hypothetical protein DFH09DRAFT_1372961 [Mycena vulgaris]|nr:hypothetical protein DFH09DRAFT_1293303 [Mycena vulgaris]KAJ6521640.1 hypothetical protein DFH09DRAFT_1372961 [Mycena vulgaris]